jgi:molybdate transport system ATP-binding protein
VPGIGVALSGCTLRLGGRSVLERVTIDVPPGAKLLVVGANGAGKTQLIKLLGGLRWPTASEGGERRYRAASGRPLELVEVREHIAYVGAESQDKYTRHGWNLSLSDVVATGLSGTDLLLEAPDADGRRRVASLLVRFGLAGVAGRRMLEVSYGQRRLALVARALASRPRLLLLDEVFNGLDDGHRSRLRQGLRGVARSAVTIVATAHRPGDVPPGLQSACEVRNGRVRRSSLPAALAGLERESRRRRGGATTRGVRAHGAGAVIELRGVSVYRDERLALRQLDWALGPGEHWAITGRNGAGKSTLLGLLYGMYPAAAGGELLRRGHPRGTPLEEIRASIGFVSPELQADYDPAVTLEEIVVSGLHDSVGLDGPPTRRERSLAREALAATGLGEQARRLPREVSYGELRLALLARAFVKRPRLLLLDEPFTGLDSLRRQQLRSALSGLARGGTQLVIAIHHLGDLPPEVNRCLHLRQGRGQVRRLPRSTANLAKGGRRSVRRVVTARASTTRRSPTRS